MTTPDDHSPDVSPSPRRLPDEPPVHPASAVPATLLRLTELVCYAVQTEVGERDGNTISKLFSFDTSSSFFPITQVAAKWTYVTYIRHICNIYLPFIPFLLSSVTEVLPVSDGFIIFACRWESQAYTSPPFMLWRADMGRAMNVFMTPLQPV